MNEIKIIFNCSQTFISEEYNFLFNSAVLPFDCKVIISHKEHKIKEKNISNDDENDYDDYEYNYEDYYVLYVNNLENELILISQINDNKKTKIKYITPFDIKNA